MIIPINQLQADTLTAIIEQFVLREGTDYGENMYSMEQKVAHVRSQLERGDAVVVYSELHDSVDIVPEKEYKRLLQTADS